MSVKERLKKFIAHQNLSVVSFEKSIGAGNGYVYSISKSIGLDKLEKVIEYYPILNIVWLLTGKGEMLEQANIMVEEESVRYNLSRKSDEEFDNLPIEKKLTRIFKIQNTILKNQEEQKESLNNILLLNR